MAVSLLGQFGDIPPLAEDLKSVKWMGDYTAAAVLCMSVGEPLPMVDEGVRRLIGRYSENEKISFQTAMGLLGGCLSRNSCRKANLGMIDLSATVCTATNPKCPHCPLAQSYRWNLKHVSSSYDCLD